MSPGLGRRGRRRTMRGVKRRVILITVVAALVAATVYGWSDVRQARAFRRLIAEGDAALGRGQTSAALEAFSGAVALRPQSMLPYLKRGDTYRRDGQFDSAARDLAPAQALDPTAPQPLELEGDVRHGAGRRRRSRGALSRLPRARRSRAARPVQARGRAVPERRSDGRGGGRAACAGDGRADGGGASAPRRSRRWPRDDSTRRAGRSRARWNCSPRRTPRGRRWPTSTGCWGARATRRRNAKRWPRSTPAGRRPWCRWRSPTRATAVPRRRSPRSIARRRALSGLGGRGQRERPRLAATGRSLRRSARDPDGARGARASRGS